MGGGKGKERQGGRFVDDGDGVDDLHIFYYIFYLQTYIFKYRVNSPHIIEASKCSRDDGVYQ